MGKMRSGAVPALWIAAAIVLGAAIPASALDFVGWRIDGSGRYPDAAPFTDWEAQTGTLWSTPMPGVSNSSPVVYGDRLFTTAEPSTLLCLSTIDGSILWERTNNLEDLPEAVDVPDMQDRHAHARELRKQINQAQGTIRKAQTDLKDDPDNAEIKARIEQARETLTALRAQLQPYSDAWYSLPAVNPTNGYASATPACDGEYVYWVLGTGLVVCYDLDGNKQWARVVGKPTIEWGASASPVVSGETLIVQVKGMAGLDKRTGETLWEAAVPDAWGTAAVTQIGETLVVISPSGSIVRVADGALLAAGVAKLEFATPILDQSVVYFVQHGGKAIRLPGAVDEGGLAIETLWTTQPNKERYYASTVLHDGLLYACTRYQVFSCIDAADGSIVYEQNLNLGKGEVYPSITFAGGLIFAANDGGSTVIIRPGRVYEEISRQHTQSYRGSPVFIGDRVYIRGLQSMLCLGPGGGG